MKHIAVNKYQGQSKNESTQTNAPKVRLYVEHPEKPEDWLVNIGHVTDRGRWRTEPHSHPDYGQVIFVRRGRGEMNLDGQNVPFEGPCALVLPTECVHGLNYEIDADRWVVTIDVSYLAQLNARLPEFLKLWAGPRTIPLANDFEAATELYNQIRRIEQEIESKSAGHVVGTEALLTSLLLMLIRKGNFETIDGEDATHNETKLVDRFRELIDKHYRQNLQVNNYASLMAVSMVQLRAACDSATGHSPTKLIHARVVTEAKRSLIFGDMSVEQIAYWLGFSDAAYFARFFRKEVGQSPSQFRATSRRQQDHAE